MRDRATIAPAPATQRGRRDQRDGHSGGACVEPAEAVAGLELTPLRVIPFSNDIRGKPRVMFRTVVAASIACFALNPASAAPAQNTAYGTGGPQVRAARSNANWAGWVATAPGPGFSSVKGTWTQPAVDCSAGGPSYSVFWVGLGGYLPGSQALEQIGTSAGCTSGGTAVYRAWWEVVPAPMVRIRMRISPGDTITASVSTHWMVATLTLDDLTTGESLSVRPSVGRVDATTAEWIAEAPSLCIRGRGCTALPLANFGTVAFSAGKATSDDRTGSIGDPAWTTQDVEVSGTPGAGSATPTPLSTDGSAFQVAWRAAVPDEPAATG